MVNMSNRQQPDRDEKYQLKAIHGSSMNDEETHTTKGKLHLVPTRQKVDPQNDIFKGFTTKA